MTERLLVVQFGSSQGLLGAVGDLQALGHRVLDVLGPHPVHGLCEALGQRPSRLPWVCLAAGLAGLVGGLALQVWTSSVDWPLDVGGKPTASWPAFVPVAFELIVLCAGLCTVAAFFLRERLSRPRLPDEVTRRATDDRFVIVARAQGAAYDLPALSSRLAQRWQALEVREALTGQDEFRRRA